MISRLENNNSGPIEVIVKYSGNINRLEPELNVEIEILSNNYAIITLLKDQIRLLYRYPEIEYIELSKNLSYELNSEASKSCIPVVKEAYSYNLSGKGVIIGIIDSGIDYTHPAFVDQLKKSRILSIWDQTTTKKPPNGFKSGTEYLNEEINNALASSNPLEIIPAMDEIGHGTAVAGIACANANSNPNNEIGIAPEASIIAVKLGLKGYKSFVRTTEIMRSLKYIVDKARDLNMPVVINISFGTNDGSHDGKTLFEGYINEIAQTWKTTIVVASGNEGSSGHHFRGNLKKNSTLDIEFIIKAQTNRTYLSIWKNFVDDFSYEVISPTGKSTGTIELSDPPRTLVDQNTTLVIQNRQPNHYNDAEEIFLSFSSPNIILQGNWKIKISAKTIVDGIVDAWLPTIEEVSLNTSFFKPDTELTLTIPSTAANVITVGAYNSWNNSSADFSGRGYTRNIIMIKPDLVAPGVNVLTTSARGGYNTFTGTSMAAPFVTGAVALMMEWGIVKNNDIFLYGERVKAFLRRGAIREENINYPNPITGYGKLCLKNTMDLLETYKWRVQNERKNVIKRNN